VNLATFRDVFPEFGTSIAPEATDEQIQAQLDFAAQSISASIFGGSYEQAHGLLAAHYIALAPGGQQARLDPKQVQQTETSTTYGLAFLRIRNKVTTARRVF
jgi:hypothetical protein